MPGGPSRVSLSLPGSLIPGLHVGHCARPWGAACQLAGLRVGQPVRHPEGPRHLPSELMWEAGKTHSQSRAQNLVVSESVNKQISSWHSLPLGMQSIPSRDIPVTWLASLILTLCFSHMALSPLGNFARLGSLPRTLLPPFTWPVPAESSSDLGFNAMSWGDPAEPQTRPSHSFFPPVQQLHIRPRDASPSGQALPAHSPSPAAHFQGVPGRWGVPGLKSWSVPAGSTLGNA